MERTIDIDDGEHTSDLVKNLHVAWKEERLCDVTIKVGSKKIPCHKIVLSEGCKVFKEMFAHRMKENESVVSEMKDVDPECMMMCIEYIYTGKVSLLLQKVLELLQAARMLQLTKLCGKIEFCLEDGLDAETFFATKKIANTLSLKRLENACNKCAMENFQSIAAMDEFKKLEEKYLTFLIRSKENQANESVKCKALLVWSCSDKKSRTEAFEKNFLSLDFSKISKQYLRHLVENEELVFNSASCLRRLMKSRSDASNVVSLDVNLKTLNVSSHGGIAVVDKESNTLKTLNIEEKTWNVIKNLSNDFARKDFTAVVAENDIYVLAHDKSNYRLRYVDLNASWVRIPDRTCTTVVAAVVYDDKIYAFDNWNEDSRSIERLNATATLWSYVCNKPVSGFGSVVVAAGDFIYCIGGSDGSNLNNVTRFEPHSETWTTMPYMPTPRYCAAAVYLDAKIYVVGGWSDPECLATNECFDTTTQTWTTLAALLHPRSYFQACSIQGKIYAVGGIVFANDISEYFMCFTNAIEEYDPSTNEWKIVETITGKQIQPLVSVALR